MEKLKKFAYKEKLTSTKLNKMVDAVNAKPDVVFLNEYEGEGKVLPTLKATFLYFDEEVSDGETYMTHGRTIYDIDNEIAGTPKYYHVFCCAHDKEQSGGGNGYIYIVYDDTLNYVRTYRITEGSGIVPVVILRAFGEDSVYTDLSNLSDKGRAAIETVAGASFATELSQYMEEGATAPVEAFEKTIFTFNGVVGEHVFTTRKSPYVSYYNFYFLTRDKKFVISFNRTTSVDLEGETTEGLWKYVDITLWADVDPEIKSQFSLFSDLSNLSEEGEEKIRNISGIGDINVALAAILGTEV